MKEMIIIYDLGDVLFQLEMEVIRFLVDTKTLGLNGYTVNDLKLAWVEERLEEMLLVTLNQHNYRVNLETRIRLKELGAHLDSPLYNTIRIPNNCYGYFATPAKLEIRGNDLYIRFKR